MTTVNPRRASGGESPPTSNGRSSPSPNGRPKRDVSDFELVFREAERAEVMFPELGRILADKSDDLFRDANKPYGLLHVTPSGETRTILEPTDFMSFLHDRIPSMVFETATGKLKNRVPDTILRCLIRTELFLSHFRLCDHVTRIPFFRPNFELCKPGYTDDGPDHRIFYVGDDPQVSTSLEYTERFLRIMEFDSNASRTNTVAAALTVMLRDRWPGGKPLIVSSASKSHSGKDTVIDFACTVDESVPISYQTTNWATELAITRAIKTSPDAAVIVVDNARVDRRQPIIASAILERIITSPRPFVFSSAKGESLRCVNRYVFAISTNEGALSEDLLNRSMSIRLVPTCDVSDRQPPIGNPKLEYLPKHKDRIAAEIRGMVVKWVMEGMPPAAKEYKHSFTPWARTVGAILEFNGFRDFLANYGETRRSVDPRKQAIAILGASTPDTWLRPSVWAESAHELGLTKALIDSTEWDTPASRTRGIGKVFSRYVAERFLATTEDFKFLLLLEKSRHRGKEKEPKVHYRFRILGEPKRID